MFPSQIGDTGTDKFYRAVNKVEPSLNRVEADELTYSLHIVIRFELEKKMVTGDLQVPDIPEAWNEKYREYLGVRVPSDAEGCLQDVHWSGAMIGYFPSYALGNLYGAQIMKTCRDQIPGLDAELENGRLSVLLKWLRENVHRHGCSYTAEELVEKLTGEPLHYKYFLDYLKAKYAPLYGL
jgi:carboxypeptidase Taq